MRLLKISIISAALFVGAVILNGLNVRADVGEFPEPGGLITTGDKANDVQMVEETVVFQVKNNDGIFSGVETQQYAHVKADFLMHNNTRNDSEKKLMFPFHFMNDAQYLEQMGQAKNVKVFVDSQEQEVTYEQLGLADGSMVLAGVFNANFPSATDVAITVEYDLRAVNEPKSGDITFEYMMQTGSHWASDINKGKVVFDFEQDITSNVVFSRYNDFFQLVDGDLQWDFTDLEPTVAHDITVSYDPENMDAWFARPSYISDVRVDGYVHGGVYVSNGMRLGEELPGGRWNANPINLIDTVNTDRGWLVEQKTTEVNHWLEFIFDDVYAVSGMQIRPGYQDNEWSNEKAKNLDYYDSFKRPKTVVITFSDGSIQDFVLEDDPSALQEIKFADGKQMNSIKFAFSDAYPGVNDGDNYFGVGRVNFVGVQKVTDISTEADGFSFGGGTAVLLIVGGIVLGAGVVGGTIFAIIVNRRRAIKKSVAPESVKSHIDGASTNDGKVGDASRPNMQSGDMPNQPVSPGIPTPQGMPQRPDNNENKW